jgi:O-antigen/teichoic acid export membrane protein
MNLIARRLLNSTVAWSWGFNFLRLASGLLLLPLLMKLLPKAEFGMYYVFLSLNGIVAVLDLGFSPTIGRFVTYAMGGATKLSEKGVSEEQANSSPNYLLLWQLLGTARVYYGYLVLATALLLGFCGSYLVWRHAHETTYPSFTWLAWGVSVLAVCTETYFNVWNMFLRNMNQVLAATRIYFMAYAIRLVLACAFLIVGGGLLSLPLASLLTSFMIWRISRARCLRELPRAVRPEHIDWRAHFRTIWPNSWRLGLYFGGGYLTTNANVLLCTSTFGLESTGSYAFSAQVINIVTGMAGVWTLVKWPLAGQLIMKRDLDSLRGVLWPRVWLQLGTYAVLAVAAITFGPWLIRLIGSDKEMLPLLWISLLALNGFLETHCSIWNTLISMWNELPMLWPTLATNAVGFVLNFSLLQIPEAQPGWLVLGPLMAGAALNYWYWPGYGARMLDLGWFEFLRHGWKRRQAFL